MLQNQNYITVAKQIWNTIEENFRIAEKVEDKLRSKVDEFNKLLLAKFPELTQSDVDNLRQAIAGYVNAGKEAVISNSDLDLIKQLQDTSTSLQTENASLRDQFKQSTIFSYNSNKRYSNYRQ